MNRHQRRQAKKHPSQATAPSLEAAAEALRHLQAGKLAEAEQLYRHILALHPRHAQSLHLLGMTLYEGGNHEAAAGLLKKALAEDGGNAALHSDLGNVLRAQGKYGEALAAYAKAVALKPDYAEAQLNFGSALQSLGRFEEAIERYRQALSLKPDLAQAHNNLGAALKAQGKYEEAAESIRRALTLNPNYAEAYVNLGAALQSQGRLAEAEVSYAKAIALRPNYAAAYNNLGTALKAQTRLQEAAAAYGKALALKPDYAEACNNLGTLLEAQGRFDEAMEHYRRACSLKPDYAEAHVSEAMLELLQGDFASGRRDYEWRWRQGPPAQPMRRYPQPLWNGERLSSGSVLIWGEQGVGDEIMFAGLMPDAIRTGNRLTLECRNRIKPLFARSFPEIEVVSEKDPAPDFAAHLPSGSLLRLFRPDLESFSATASPYLIADPEARERIRRRYADGRKLVGLAWHTNNWETGATRSIGLSLFAPLFARKDIRWVSLQYGNPESLAAEAEAAGAPLLFDRDIDQMADLDAFAAQVAALDLVITIDNSTAHLAGALGVPAWVMLPHAPNWRWLLHREDSPWYPAMRLFRQPQPGNWQPVIEKLSIAF